MNKNFVNIADNLLKKRKDIVDVKNDEYLSGSVENDYVFNEISDSEILNYIKTLNPNKSVRSDVPNIRFVKLSAKIISPYLSKFTSSSFINCIINVLSMVCFLSHLNLLR